MSYKVREVDVESKWCQEAVLEVFPRVLPPELVNQVLKEEGAVTKRERKLNLRWVTLSLIALHLFPRQSLGGILRKIAHILLLLRDEESEALPGPSALNY